MSRLEYLCRIAERCRECAADLRRAGAPEAAVKQMLMLAARFEIAIAAERGLCQVTAVAVQR